MSECKRAKKARWVPTTTNDLLMKRIDLFSCLCLVKGNTANFFNPFFLRINWVRSWCKRVALHQPILTCHVSKTICFQYPQNTKLLPNNTFRLQTWCTANPNLIYSSASSHQSSTLSQMLAKSVGAVTSVVSQLKVCFFFFFFDLLFPQILDFEILIDLDNFLDINHLIWYGFCCFLFCIFMGFDWILEWQVQTPKN